MPKPMEGVMRSHPCLAEPVKLDILCMLVALRIHSPQHVRDGSGELAGVFLPISFYRHE
jgi:hypothetical protein